MSVDLVLKKKKILDGAPLDSQGLRPFPLNPFELGQLCAESFGRPERAKNPESEGTSGWSWMQLKLPACGSKEVIHAEVVLLGH